MENLNSSVSPESPNPKRQRSDGSNVEGSLGPGDHGAPLFKLDSPGNHQKLSDREYQVMCLLASGKTVKETSSQLGLGVKTISTYRTRILKKMGLRNNAQLSAKLNGDLGSK